MIKRISIVAGLLATCTVALAHHSYAKFDLRKQEKLQGQIRAVEWTNPHVWVWVNRSDAKGVITAFGLETVAPGELIRNYGWSKASLKVGDKVTVEYSPLRSGQNGGSLQRVIFPDGRVLNTPGIHFAGPPPKATEGSKP